MNEVIIDGVVYIPKHKENSKRVQDIVETYKKIVKMTETNTSLMLHCFKVDEFGDDFEVSDGDGYPVAYLKSNRNLVFFPEK